MSIKKISMVVLSLLGLSMITGCGNEKSNEMKVSATLFPAYDFVREITKGEVDVDLILKPGTDLHSFDPTPKDIVNIQESDLFIYIGSEKWAYDIIETLDTKKTKVIRLMDYVDLKEELITDGMEHNHDHEEEHHDHEHNEDCDHEHHDHDHEDCDHEEEHHDHEHNEDCDHEHNEDCDHEHHDHEHEHHDHEEEDHDHDHEHHEDCDHEHHDNSKLSYNEIIKYDEHIWTSIKNCIVLVEEINEELIKIDEKNKEKFNENTKNYIEKLEEKDNEFETIFENANNKNLIVADRFPFTYFVNDYNITAYAAFTGCSSSTNASPKTLSFLINKMKELNVKAIYHVELSNKEIANAITENTKVLVKEFNSGHNMSKSDFDKGVTYLDIINNNLENIKSGF